jgi:hypothetical protein
MNTTLDNGTVVEIVTEGQDFATIVNTAGAAIIVIPLIGILELIAIAKSFSNYLNNSEN